MQLFNSPMRYGLIAQCLHWAAVALLVLAWTLGVLGDEFPEGASRALALYVVIALLFADWIGLGAKLAHFALYVLLVTVPVVGIILQFARGDSLSILGFVDVASPWVRDKAFAEGVKEVHEVLAHCLLAMAGLHAIAALIHHWVFGDRTLVRMLPGSKS